MSNSEVLIAMQNYDIKLIGNIDFLTKREEIIFLNILEKLKKEDINLKLLNEDLIHILLKIELTEKTLKSLKQINWNDFDKLFTEHTTKRREKIYQNYMQFLRNDLDILEEDEEIEAENTLLEAKEGNKENKVKRNHFNKRIYELNENFNIEEDLKEKAKKFGVNIEFDYTVDPKKLSVSDFTLYFNRRLQYFTELLSSRVAAENIVRISQLPDLYGSNTEVTLIGLISEITQTTKGHIMITLEDKSGQIKCFINKDKQDLMKFVEDFCLDEGIGIRGKVGDNIIWCDEIIIPSPPMNAELKRTEEENYVAFLSDIHFGARVFQDEAFQKFLDFVNGETSNDKLNNLSKKLKTIIIAGDLIEGIGIYPNQGKDARILSTEKQYHECARWLSQIPKHISIIIIPGNHDTDRLSEPQPKLPYHKAYALYNMENVLMISNPSIVRLFEEDKNGGLVFYIYHGGSYPYYGDKIKKLREKGGMKVPEEIVKFLLEKRHLAPSHGATLYIPDSQNDPLVIRKMPDFFITGHTHKLSLANYKGCTIVSCGCWVEMSDYQEKMGMFPDVGKVPIVNTKTRKPHILNFYTEEYKKKQE
jgi:DNA polymerase II small subunit